jgi:hypothetical protein
VVTAGSLGLCRNSPRNCNLFHWNDSAVEFYYGVVMPFPIKVCAVCSEEFELKPDKPGFANRCPSCSEPESDEPASGSKRQMDADERKAESEANEARRKAIRELLYRKDS